MNFAVSSFRQFVERRPVSFRVVCVPLFSSGIAGSAWLYRLHMFFMRVVRMWLIVIILFQF